MSFYEEKIASVYDENTSKKIIEGCSKKRKTTLRINTIKIARENAINILKENKINFSVSPFSDTAIIIESGEEKIRNTSLYNNGEIYLQSLSSQLPALLLSAKENEDVLDMTAAPGGKTSQIAMLTSNKCNLTACEMNPKRSERLKYNLLKQGVTCVNIMTVDARNLENFFSFDKILLDAPCSGSGTINLSNEKEVKGFTDTLVNKCVKWQSSLLDKALTLLKKGGEAVYSTCSVLPEENEKALEKLLKKHNCITSKPDTINTDCLPLLPCSLENGICICPNEEFEGFFMIKIKKL